MAILTTTLDDKTFNDIILDAQFDHQETELVVPLVNYRDISDTAGLSVVISVVPKPTELTEHTENAVVSEDTAFNTWASVTITAKEYANYIQMSKQAIKADGVNAWMKTAKQLSGAFTVSRERAVTSLFPSFTKSFSPGTAAGNTLTPEHIIDGISYLKEQNAFPMGGAMYCVLHTRQARDVSKALLEDGADFSAASDVANRVGREMYLGMYHGCQVFESNLAPTAFVSGNSGPQTATGAVFVKDAITFVNKGDVEMSVDYTVNRVSYEMGLDGMYSAGIVQNNYGCKLISHIGSA